jgi:phosphomethylpyrimidine synthase
MKITQEVRDFAAKQNAGAETFVAANPPGDGEGDHLEDGGGAPATLADAEAGMAEMSEKFREVGSELYVGAGAREHD